MLICCQWSSIAILILYKQGDNDSLGGNHPADEDENEVCPNIHEIFALLTLKIFFPHIFVRLM